MRAAADHRAIALKLSYATVAYNVLEGMTSVVFAVLAGSSALLGFGIDSFVESLSGIVMIWRFSHPGEDGRSKREKQGEAKGTGVNS